MPFSPPDRCRYEDGHNTRITTNIDVIDEMAMDYMLPRPQRYAIALLRFRLPSYAIRHDTLPATYADIITLRRQRRVTSMALMLLPLFATTDMLPLDTSRAYGVDVTLATPNDAALPSTRVAILY